MLWDQNWCAGFRLVETDGAVDLQEWRGGQAPPKVERFPTTAAAEAAAEAATPAHIQWRQSRVGAKGASAVVYVPTEEGERRLGLAPGSGAVGVALGSGVHLYYEGNLYQAANLRTWQERVTCAAGRLFKRYPTVAQSFVQTPGELLMPVGVITDDYRLEVLDQASVDAFLTRSTACAGA